MDRKCIGVNDLDESLYRRRVSQARNFGRPDISHNGDRWGDFPDDTECAVELTILQRLPLAPHAHSDPFFLANSRKAAVDRQRTGKAARHAGDHEWERELPP
jgi:hypothetical protein